MSKPPTSPRAWAELNEQIVACSACPRLVEHCQAIAAKKRAAYRHWEYWARPVPNFGDPRGRVLLVGLAPGAHGSNRTGRMFTGDASGDWLYRALHKAGFASQPKAHDRNDELRLIDCAITSAVHCAPPDNMPASDERDACRQWLDATLELSPAKVLVALGGLAWGELVSQSRRRNWYDGKTPKFAHLRQVALTEGRWLLGSYHPSRQNTNTGRLTEAMLDEVFNVARRLASGDQQPTRARNQKSPSLEGRGKGRD